MLDRYWQEPRAQMDLCAKGAWSVESMDGTKVVMKAGSIPMEVIRAVGLHRMVGKVIFLPRLVMNRVFS